VRAFLVWLAWQDGHPEDVITAAKRIAAQEATAADIGSRFRKWVYLWPLIAAYLETGQVAEAVAAARELVEPAQQWLPGDLTARLDAASTAWQQDRQDAAREELAAALTLANELRYF
jgi:hypothetical protein